MDSYIDDYKTALGLADKATSERDAGRLWQSEYYAYQGVLYMLKAMRKAPEHHINIGLGLALQRFTCTIRDSKQLIILYNQRVAMSKVQNAL